MKINLVLGFALATSVGCAVHASQARFPASALAAPPCITDADVDGPTAMMTHAADLSFDSSAGPQPPPTLLSSTCTIRKYRYRNRRFIYSLEYSRDPKTNGATRTVNATMAEAEPPTPACWSRAQAELSALHSIVADRALQTFRRAHDLLWDEPDLGPSHWLSCTDEQADRLADEVTVVHETVHELTGDLKHVDGKRCLYNVDNEHDAFCFELTDDLPPRSLATRATYPIEDAVEDRFVRMIESMYMDTQPPLRLFDELDAYTIGERIVAAQVNHFGRGAMHDQHAKRQVTFMPMIATYVLRYLSRLREQNPALYAKNFGPEMLNHKTLTRLFAAAIAAHAEWEAAFKRAGIEPKMAESAIWQDALTTAKAAGLR